MEFREAMVFMVFAIVMIFLGVIAHCNHDGNKELKTTHVVEQDGHLFIESLYGGIVHHPDCHCLKKSKD